MDHIKGNDAIKCDDYKIAWEKCTKALLETPKDPILWCNRAQICLKGGWPELSLLDAKRAENLLLNHEEVHTGRQKILFTAKFLYAEALSALGIPTLASFAYENLIELINESGGELVNNIDPKIYEEKRDALLSLIDKQNRIFAKKGAEEKEMTVANGWYKFFGKYPWDDRVKERLDSTVLQNFQKKLDIASNGKLRVDLVANESDSIKGFRVVADQDILDNEVIFENDPFLTVHNRYELRCDYCVHSLLDPSNELEIIRHLEYPEYPKRFPCPNPQCRESFCNLKCYSLAMDLYHKQICGKNIEKIIEFAQTSKSGIGLEALFSLKLFAMAKIMNICPLDIEEIKYLHRYQSFQDFQDGYNVWESKLEEIYMEILNSLDISLYDIKYDFWIFITILNILKSNIFEGPPRTVDEEETDAVALFPLASLVNHDCDPNSIHFETLSETWIKYEHIDKIKEMRSYYKDCHSFKMFVENCKPIKKGEQIFISYCDTDYDKEARQGMLMEIYGFKCNCLKCENEPGDYKQKHIAWHLYFPKQSEK